MVANANSTQFGLGIYTPAEAARFARVPVQTISRWVFGNKSGNAVIERQLRTSEKVVTFLDFVQALAIRAIRHRYSIPLQRIRDAVNLAKEKYGVDYPFAVAHKTYFFNGDILIQVGSIDHPELVQVSGDRKNQRVLHEVAELYMDDLHFDIKNRTATKFDVFKYAGQKIVMDPEVRLGQPFFPDCGYSADSLISAYTTEGSVEAASEAMGVSSEFVKTALRFDDYLQSPSAA